MTAEISPAVRLPWAILSPNRVFGAYSSEIWIGLRKTSSIVAEIYFCNDRAKHFFHRRLYQKKRMRRGRGLSGSRRTTPSWPRNSLASRWARPRRWRSRPESPFTRTCRCGASRRSTPPWGRRTPCSPRPRTSLFPWPADRKGTRRRRTGSSIRPDPFYASIPRIRIRRAFFRVRPSRGRFVYEG